MTIGEHVRLDASASTHPGGRRLTYHWALETPPDSGAKLDDASALRPSFSVDLLGDYVATLTVSDGLHTSEADQVLISTGNIPPV